VAGLLPNHIAPRLIVFLTLIVVLVEGTFGYLNIAATRSQLVAHEIQATDQLSRSLTSATWHAMLADHREDAYRVMETMAHRQGIERIRLTNSNGKVRFATDPGAAAEIRPADAPCRELLAGGRPDRPIPARARTRLFTSAKGSHKLGMVTAIYNETSCSTAACHAHPPDRATLGVLDVVVNIDHVDEEVASFTWRQVGMSLTHLLVIGIFVLVFTRYMVSRPIARLIEGTQAVSAMDLDRPIMVDSPTELGELARAFDTMRVRLRDAKRQIERFTQTLEEKVEARTRDLDAARLKLIQSDRLASLGQLSASVAHEINNPVGAVLNLSMVLQRILQDDGVPAGREEEVRKHLARIVDETKRVGRIVSDLLAFSRRSKAERIPADLNEIVERTLALIQHKLDLAAVTCEPILDRTLPAAACDAAQIEQVILNLVMNAAEAMTGGGKVTVRTGWERGSDQVHIQVEDRGPGIAPDLLDRIYDPFFTTKEAEKGVGLGLAVVYGIVESHAGTVDVESRPGRGAVFTVRLPIADATRERDR